MRIGIDASNLSGGGGITHLAALLAHVDSAESDLESAIVWGRRATLARLPERSWLVKRACPELEGSALARLAWQKRRLPALAARECDLLFAPGGLCGDRFHPVVTMSRNMLPFQRREMWRYGASRMLARLAALRRAQARSFATADGVIFLSHFARRTVERVAGPVRGAVAIIPHGVERSFFRPPRRQRSLAECSPHDPLRLVYTSIIDVYKHPWNVARAVAGLRREGLPVAVDFIGESYPPALRRLSRTLRRHDPQGGFLRYAGPVEHAALAERYREAELFVFASSCENLPNVLLEAMAAGLPIACSDRGPMPEVLGDGGIYFNPLHPTEIAAALRRLAADAALRGELAAQAHARAQSYSWTTCARDTLDFLRRVVERHAVRGNFCEAARTA
jgi:glycosyltransferase involved in cell wall biosynthesis